MRASVGSWVRYCLRSPARVRKFDLFEHTTPAVEARHKRLGLMEIDSDILAYGCTSWLRVVPSHLGEEAPLEHLLHGPSRPHSTSAPMVQPFSFHHSLFCASTRRSTRRYYLLA